MDTATNPIPAILDLLRDNRLIEAIKVFRTTYGGGLREAKDAVEAIRDACVSHGGKPVEYLVVSREETETSFQVRRTDSKEYAMMVADGLVYYRAEVVVVSVIARSVVTRHMQEVREEPDDTDE